MPLTLEQAKALSQDKLTNFVIDEFRRDALMDSLVYDDSAKPQGGESFAYVYNRIKTQPTAAGRAINTEYTAQETVTEQKVINLKIFGGSFKIDRALIAHERQVVNHIEFQMGQKIKATRALFSDWFINGDSGTNPLAFDGLDKAITGSTTEITPGASIDLSTSANIDTNWKVFLDSLRKLRARLDGTATLILMNTDMFGKFQSVMDRAGINLTSKENYGSEVVQWGPSLVISLGDKPGTANPIIETSSGETSVYSVRIGLDGVHGITPEGAPVIKTYLPNLKEPGAVKAGEVEMIGAVAIKATQAAGVLRKIKID